MITQRSTSTGNVVTKEAITLRDTEILKGQKTRLFLSIYFIKSIFPQKKCFDPSLKHSCVLKLLIESTSTYRQEGSLLFVVFRLSMLAVFNVNFNQRN